MDADKSVTATFVEDVDLLRPWVLNAFGLSEGEGKTQLYLIGAPFQIKVWEALLSIPSGQVTTYSEIAQAISNLSNDCSSDIKYWHVCKVMGRVASHLALEVALQTHANMTLIGEDLANYVDTEWLIVGVMALASLVFAREWRALARRVPDPHAVFRTLPPE